MDIYTDGAFSWKSNLNSEKKKGKIAFKLGKKEVKIQEMEIEEVFGLKQYSNLFELRAVLEALKRTRAKKIHLFTDSQVIYWWLKNGKDLSRISNVHQEIQREIFKRIVRLRSFSVNWIPREKNLAGIALENLEKANLKTKIARVRNDGRWHSRGSDWATPQELFDKLDKEFHFTLDPCASDWNAKCKRFFTKKEDGLKQNWGKEIVFMNPPYGKVLKDWMKKAYESSLKGATVVCLVPAATDTSWWHDYAMKGEIRFLRGRPRFLTKEGRWQQTFSPSVIVIFKNENRKTKTKIK